MERRLYRGFGRLLHTARPGRRAGHRPRCERLPAREHGQGQSITLSNSTTREWFNTAAFCAPSATCVNPNGTTFGDAGRNIIEGPGQVTLDMALNKTISIKESRALDLRLSANNVFNNVHFTSINTVVNSLAFGEVTGTGSMRRVTVTARFRF